MPRYDVNEFNNAKDCLPSVNHQTKQQNQEIHFKKDELIYKQKKPTTTAIPSNIIIDSPFTTITDLTTTGSEDSTIPTIGIKNKKDFFVDSPIDKEYFESNYFHLIKRNSPKKSRGFAEEIEALDPLAVSENKSFSKTKSPTTPTSPGLGSRKIAETAKQLQTTTATTATITTIAIKNIATINKIKDLTKESKKIKDHIDKTTSATITTKASPLNPKVSQQTKHKANQQQQQQQQLQKQPPPEGFDEDSLPSEPIITNVVALINSPPAEKKKLDPFDHWAKHRSFNEIYLPSISPTKTSGRTSAGLTTSPRGLKSQLGSPTKTLVDHSASLFLEDPLSLPTGRRRSKVNASAWDFEENYRLLSLRKRKPVQVEAPKRRAKRGKHKGRRLTKKQLKEQEDLCKVIVPDHQNRELLERIDVLEYDVKPIGRKRKRVFSFNTRKRTRAPKVPKVVPIDKVDPEQIAPLPVEAVPIQTQSAEQQRQLSMSLYERRFQAADDGRGVNGYLSSRGSSAGSSSAVHSDGINDAQDSSNPYYISASSGSSTSGNGSNVNVNVNLNHTPSMATLCNIGNTCYLNSVVYTLRFAPNFLHNLHHLIQDLGGIQQYIGRQRAKTSSLGRGISVGHMENARSWSSKDLASMEQYNSNAATGPSSNSNSGKSSHQLLTERLHELYANLHRNETLDSSEPFHADTLLHAVQDVSPIFEGNQQQDAHEFLMCILNSIRETSQTLIKLIGESPDLISNGYLAGVDDVDSVTNEKDSPSALVNCNNNNTNLSTTSSSSSKTSFFSRKSKRKDEVKASKNNRIQSPLKDGGSSQQPTSNSLFYLNTVDLSGSSSGGLSAGAGGGGGGGGSLTPLSNLSSSTSSTGSSNRIGDESPSSISVLLDKERLSEKIKELGLDFFSEDFEGVTVATTKCLSCETITEQKESMIDIAVPVPISGYDSSDYTEKPSAFIQNSCITREYFRGENKYRCEQCTGYTEAIRSISYEVLPRLLVIQLSRFSGGMEKINSYIPTSFTLQCFCSKCCELSDANKLHIYKLYSVITHVGATMSVGHYIAYTCSLDVANEYTNCPKERRSNGSSSGGNGSQFSHLQHTSTNLNGLPSNLNAGNQTQQGTAASSSSTLLGNATAAASSLSTASSSLASSGTSLIKKMKFGFSKASSSGDMSKNMKNVNGISSKSITNGMGKLSMNTTCPGLNCCAMRICSEQQHHHHQQQHQNAFASGGGVGGGSAGGGSSSSTSSSGYNSNDYSEESLQNGTNANLNFNSNYPSGYGSTGRGGIRNPYSSSPWANTSEPVWYMCDDDKIKAMSQKDFEELLSPARKITITPYLLFYARFDLQPNASASGSGSTSSSSTQKPNSTNSSNANLSSSSSTTTPQTSWSNENLQSSPGLASVSGTSAYHHHHHKI